MKLLIRAQTLGLLLALAPLCALAETLIRLDLPQDYSRLAVREMKAELGRIAVDAGLDLRWAPESRDSLEVNGRLVFVSLRGRCTGVPGLYETGPLGWTKMVNGRVIPFIEIACGRVLSLLDPVWKPESDVMRELYLGRALGRVLAHELAHALARSDRHADAVLRKEALSPHELIGGRYQLEHSDFERPGESAHPAPSQRAVVSIEPAAIDVELDSSGR